MFDGGTEKSLVELDWRSASSSFGQVRKNANCQGGPIRVRGNGIATGIGAHANSVVVYDLPKGVKRFRAQGVLDDGGTVRGNEPTTPTSVRFVVFNQSAGVAGAGSPADEYVKKSSDPGREASEAIPSLEVHPDLEAQLFASEPMITSPSSIDIDHRGRVWVCDVVNYRRNQGKRPEGDQVLILEDTDGDAKADRSTVFYQGEDVNSAHGICVLGDRVIISAGDDIFSLYDRDGDGKADPGSKEILFTNIGGKQHDHGIHAVHFGPDGRLYFNFGNAGKRLCDPEGNLITDINGIRCTSENNRPYQEGMIFRCDLDGSNVELLAWNFRNNWEACVDSFGNIWQSDNDDDGNKGVRINFVLEYGNYGYKDEFTGAGWRDPRPGMAEEIPHRHWHLEDPGVVPNLLQTGAGSPTGICVYEGTLLPEVFHGQVIHCDAGPNVVRAYPVTPDGAGYTAEMVDILRSTRDRWFRPSDACVAPDGSLFVADWYDPGVGGHGMGDIEKGRIFRVIPRDKARSYEIPTLLKLGGDFAGKTDEKWESHTRFTGSPYGLLRSPNMAARYLAWQAFAKAGEKASSFLLAQFRESDRPVLRARALWLLARLENGPDHLLEAAVDPDPDIAITAIRAGRQLHADGSLTDEQLLTLLWEAYGKGGRGMHPAICREAFIGVRPLSGKGANRLWSDIASLQSPMDRWMLEAYGIGAGDHWDERTEFFFQFSMPYDQYTRYLWRSRSSDTPKRIVKELLRDPEKKMEDEPSDIRYLRALELQPHPDEVEAAFATLFLEAEGEVALHAAGRLGRETIASLENGESRLDALLAPVVGTPEFVELAERLNLRGFEPELADFIAKEPDSGQAVVAARLLMRDRGRLLEILRDRDDIARASALVRAIGKTGDRNAGGLLAGELVRSETPAPLRIEIVNALAMNGRSGQELLKLAREDRLEASLRKVAALAIARSPDARLRSDAAQLLPVPKAPGAESFPSLSELVAQKGAPEKGAELFGKATCQTCHRVRGEGIDFGPDLSEIGNKLSREGLFEAILYPNAAISHGFHGLSITKTDGTSLVGYSTGETDETIQLRLPGGVDQEIPRKEIKTREELEQSLMPPGLGGVIGAEGLVDLVTWLETLR